MAASRKDVRELLAAMLPAYATQLKATYAYKAADFGGKSPIACVTSDGTTRERVTARDFGAQPFYVTVHFFALYADATVWTEQDAEDQLDALEAALVDLITANQHSVCWQAIEYAGRSGPIDLLTIGGVDYRHEAVPLAVYA